MKPSDTTLLVRLLVVLALALSACRGARHPGEETRRVIDDLRARAKEAPKDVALWTELAIAEHVEDGGDPKLAREAVEHARGLGAKGLALRFVESEAHVLEGRPEAALKGYLALLEESATSLDPVAVLYAEAALEAIRDMNDAVDNYRERVRLVLDPLLAQGDKLGLNAAHQLRMQLYAQALLGGDTRRSEELVRAAGCVDYAVVAGPFGPRELLGFDRPTPADKPGPLADKYDLGPGRGVQPTRNLATRRCVLALGRGAHDALPGTTVLRTELDVPNAGAYALRVESPNSIIVWVDGKETLRIDLRSQSAEGVRYVPLTLTPGKHELRAKVSSRHPNPALSVALVTASPEAVARTVLPTPSSAIERYLVAKLALARGNAVGARELLRKKNQAEPTAHWLVLEAASALADPLRPAELRRDAARELLRKAGERNPDAWYPRVGIANLEAAEGRNKEAIESLREAQKRWPDVIAVRTSLIEQLRTRGYVEEADASVRELAQRMPHACAVSALELAAARSRGRVNDVEAFTEKVMRCDASSMARFTLLKAQRKYQEAADELLRLRALGDVLDPPQALEADLERARLLGDDAKERELREKRTAMWPDRPDPVLDNADLLIAQGKRGEAVKELAKALAAHPDELYELRRVGEALGMEGLFKGFRKDGDAIIRAFEASGRTYQEPEVLVLDYTVVRVFEDGSSVDLTHNIMKMQSEEAIDENGEFNVPDGARMLTLHTVKADGRRLEPDAIAGKSSLSLPNLAPGDYIEFEHVRGESPTMGFPGGYLGNRFYFQSFEVPFDHTELVVILPAGTEPVIDPRGPAPETIRETKDGLTVLRWFKDESRPLAPEPASVTSREFIPSINLGIRVTWEAYVESLRDLLVDKDVYDPAAADEVKQLLGSDLDGPPSVRATRLHRWVTDEIEPSEEVFGLASSMFSSRTGSRERVLNYLLRLAGVESELALARGVEADHSDAKLPDPETFGYLLLRVKTEKGVQLVGASARHAPFGYLPPAVRGEVGLVLNERAERVSIPPYDLEADHRNVDVDVELAENGSATVHVRETHRGPSAVGWRNDLDEIPAADLEARFEESYAAHVIPGARLVSLTIENRDNPDVALVVDYRLEVDRLGHRVGTQQRIAGIFPASLSAQLAREGSRTTTELVAPALATDTTVRFKLPASAKVVGVPKPTNATFQGARFSSQAQASGTEVTLTRSVRVPIMRVPAPSYPALASFCRTVDVAEASELAVELP